MRKPIRIPALALSLALAPGLGAQETTVIQISSDPFTNPDSQHQTQVEPDTYSFGSTVVACFQSGRFFDGGASDIGWATSQDGGLTWTHGFLPGLTVNSTPTGPFDRVSDPSVAYDAAHDAWIIASLGLTGATGVAVVTNVSLDGGLTWSDPTLVSYKGSGFYDKNWIGCDDWPGSPFYGNCYVTWDDAFAGNQILMSTSTDGGMTWGPKISVPGAGGLGGMPIPRSDGKVLVPASNGFNQIFVFGSGNGGASWSNTRNVSNQTSHSVAGNLRATEFLFSADVDASGKLYIVWPDCRFRSGCSSNDIVMTTSGPGGTFTPVVRIPIDPTTSTVDHFIPGLAVDHGASGSTARLALTYYYYPVANCNSSTCELNVGIVTSADGGATWTAPQQLAGPMTLSWIANTNQGRMVGDYISTSFSGESAVPVFSSANAPIGGLFQQASYAGMVPVTGAEATPLAVRPEPVLSHQSDWIWSGWPRPIVLP